MKAGDAAASGYNSTATQPSYGPSSLGALLRSRSAMSHNSSKTLAAIQAQISELRSFAADRARVGMEAMVVGSKELKDSVQR